MISTEVAGGTLHLILYLMHQHGEETVNYNLDRQVLVVLLMTVAVDPMIIGSLTCN